MKFVDYTELLKKHDIFLYDSEYRISYFRLIKLSDRVYKNQFGGGSNNILSPIIILKKDNTDSNKIKKIVESLLNNNLKMAEYLCIYNN